MGELVNAVELANALAQIERRISESSISLKLAGDELLVSIPGSHTQTRLRIVRLYRPSSHDILRAAAPDVVLVLSAPSQKAAQTAERYNHITLPDGGFRLVVPGLAIVRESLPPLPKPQKRVKLTGRTGIVAETLLLGGSRPWSIHELAQASHISGGLAHRVLARLELDNIVVPQGAGRDKKRVVVNPAALAETWSQEEQLPLPLFRGYLYGASPEVIAQKVLQACPGGAAGGALAANLHQPILTKAPYPIRFWIPAAFTVDQLLDIGLEATAEGANIELLQTKDDPWRVHLETTGIPRVSPWRAWVEISSATGRTQELAEALFVHLKGSNAWK